MLRDPWLLVSSDKSSADDVRLLGRFLSVTDKLLCKADGQEGLWGFSCSPEQLGKTSLDLHLGLHIVSLGFCKVSFLPIATALLHSVPHPWCFQLGHLASGLCTCKGNTEDTSCLRGWDIAQPHRTWLWG